MDSWFELKRETVKETTIENTRVIREVNADIFCIVEAENCIAGNRFKDIAIPRVDGQKYNHVMLIDGNDFREIDVGIIIRKSFDIQSIVSHIDDKDSDGIIFSRDCLKFKIKI